MDFIQLPPHMGYRCVLVFTVCVLDGLKPFPATRLIPLEAKKMLENRFPTWGKPPIIPRDGGSCFTGQIIQVLMKVLQWSLSLLPCYQARLKELIRPPNLKSLKWMKLLDSLGLWCCLWPCWLLTGPPLRKHKLTPHETVTSRPTFISVQLSANLLLFFVSFTSYSKSWMCYAETYHQQVRKAFPDSNSKDPIGHSVVPDDWAFQNWHHRKSVLRKDSTKCSCPLASL